MQSGKNVSLIIDLQDVFQLIVSRKSLHQGRDLQQKSIIQTFDLIRFSDTRRRLDLMDQWRTSLVGNDHCFVRSYAVCHYFKISSVYFGLLIDHFPISTSVQCALLFSNYKIRSLTPNFLSQRTFSCLTVHKFWGLFLLSTSPVWPNSVVICAVLSLFSLSDELNIGPV